jgi:hypothetical protein
MGARFLNDAAWSGKGDALETKRSKTKQFRHRRGMLPTQSKRIKRAETKGSGP